MICPYVPRLSIADDAVKKLAKALGKTPYADYLRDMLTMK